MFLCCKTQAKTVFQLHCLNACIQEADAVDAAHIRHTKVTRETGMLHRHQTPIPIMHNKMANIRIRYVIEGHCFFPGTGFPGIQGIDFVPVPGNDDPGIPGKIGQFSSKNGRFFGPFLHQK